MATFNTYDYQFLLKCLSEGTIIFKAQSLKRLITLASADKKQFVNYVKGLLTNLEGFYSQEKEDLNLLSVTLLNQIILNVQNKEIHHAIFNNHLPKVMFALGHPNKTTLRKAAHTVFLNSLKVYPQFSQLNEIYIKHGFSSENQLIKQKSVNSFQSILILEAKKFDWKHKSSVDCLSFLVDHLSQDSPLVAKAASQCILSMCKMEGIVESLPHIQEHRLKSLKKFLEQIRQRMPIDTFQLKIQDINKHIQGWSTPLETIVQPENEKQSIIDIQEISQKSDIMRSSSNYKRLQKIKKSIKYEERKMEKQVQGKLFNFVSIEGTLKQRTDNMQDLLYKIQVNKNKPQFESSIKAIFPIVLKMLKDNNPKIVNITLRILQQCSDWLEHNDSYVTGLISVIVEKLGDQKISIRQNVSKVIRDLSGKTKKGLWIRQILQYMKRNTSTVLKDEALYLVNYLYENSHQSQTIPFATEDALEQIVCYLDDPKTKIKIRALDCLAAIVHHSRQQEKFSLLLKQKMSTVFYQMYLEKLNRLKEQEAKKNQDHDKGKHRETIQRTTQESYRTSQHNDVRSEGDQEESALNISMQSAKRRPPLLLRRPRHLLSTHQTISVDNSYRKNVERTQQVDIILPSLYKKTANKFITNRKAESVMNRTIEGKSQNYLSKDDLKPLRDPNQQMKSVISQLKSSDWKAQFETTNKLRRLIQCHPDIIRGTNSISIHSLVIDLINMVQNLRSSVSKNSLICLNEFVSLLNRQVDPQMEAILEKLIKKSADTSAFISSEVQKCLNTLSVSATPAKFLQKLTSYRQSKSISVKQAIVSTLLSMNERQDIRLKEFLRLAEAFAFYLHDSQLEVRSRAKVGIANLCTNLGDWYRVLRGKINPTFFKAICQLMTKSPNLRIQQISSPLKASIQTIEPERSEKFQRNSEKADLSSMRKKPAKVSQYPSQFEDIQGILEMGNSSQWKKRIEAVNKIKDIALQFPNQFCQFRSGAHFIDMICKQISEPNLKVCLNGMATLIDIFQPLKTLVQSNLSLICSGVFAGLSNSKPQVKEYAQKCARLLTQNIEYQTIIQHICHGILYALPKSRIYLLNKLIGDIEFIVEERKQLLFKNIFPLLNKLMEEYKSQLMPLVITIFERLYGLMGNAMFSHLTKFKQIRELINK